MRPETLHEVIRAAPFRPFAMILADGSGVPVPHPEWIAFAGGRIALVTDPEDRAHYVDTALVMKIEIGPYLAAGPIVPEPDRRE
jgi:hypothetical protein